MDAELGVHWRPIGQQPRRAGVTMRDGAPPALPHSIRQILELRDQVLTCLRWPQYDYSGAWSRYRKTRPAQPLPRWQIAALPPDAPDSNP